MREEAARACGELGVAEAVTTLGRLLEDPETDVILASIDALAEIGGDEAKKLLEEATHSDDEDIGTAAKEALDEFEFIHGDVKFTTDWIDDFSAEGAGDLVDDDESDDMTAA